jgi:protein-L-isoaspartate(D-aspartate) O-methyltransferase
MDFEAQRKRMVQTQLIGRGLDDQRVLDVFLEIPRHEFVSEDMMSSAYDDCPLPIGQGQTISQPYMVALMTQMLRLKPEDKVLEVGTGSGYQTAIISKLAGKVYTIERIQRLARQAQQRFEKLGLKNIEVHVGDGTLGLEDFKPFDAIIITAAAPHVPESLIGQLKEQGRLVIPVGGKFLQELMLIEKQQGRIVEKQQCGCVFVPLIGKQGWKENDY